MIPKFMEQGRIGIEALAGGMSPGGQRSWATTAAVGGGKGKSGGKSSAWRR